MKRKGGKLITGFHFWSLKKHCVVVQSANPCVSMCAQIPMEAQSETMEQIQHFFIIGWVLCPAPCRENSAQTTPPPPNHHHHHQQHTSSVISLTDLELLRPPIPFHISTQLVRTCEFICFSWHINEFFFNAITTSVIVFIFVNDCFAIKVSGSQCNSS